MQSAVVKVSEAFESPVDADTVWALISDPARVVPCMPGASLGEVHDDGSIDGAVEASLGPVRVRFSGTVSPEYDEVNRRGTLVARGSDNGGRTMASATTEFSLEPVDAERTIVRVDAKFTVSGGLAPFAQTGGVHLVRSMLEEFSSNLAQMAAGDRAATSGGAEPEPPGSTVQHKIRGLRLAASVLWSVLRHAVRSVAGRVRRLLVRRSSVQRSHERIGESHEGQ